ncbi:MULTISPECIES: histone-like nucleoid-structuring protein, MvaT/MvaU family [Pseudomonas]|uniref:histone-like nucleoid-structuring protein, MvaT/MvaU family n=1 Tax=Pseudomonas TaxID=286 RepID=UPI003B83A33D
MVQRVIAEFRALEHLLAAKKSELSFIKIDPHLKREFEFEGKLRDLLAEYQFGLSDILAIRGIEDEDSKHSWSPPLPLRRFRARQSKYYRNPYTGEMVEAKSTLNKTLQLWMQQYGREEVKRWATVWYRHPGANPCSALPILFRPAVPSNDGPVSFGMVRTTASPTDHRNRSVTEH